MSRSILNSLFDDFAPVEDLRRSARMMSQRHQRSVQDLKERIGDLEDWLGEVTLLNQAMIRLLLEKETFSRDEMAVAIHAIDILDGVEDGKVTRKKPAPKKAAGKRKKAKKKKKRS